MIDVTTNNTEASSTRSRFFNYTVQNDVKQWICLRFLGLLGQYLKGNNSCKFTTDFRLRLEFSHDLIIHLRGVCSQTQMELL